MIEKALIPIAGKATRLRPLSEVVPKAMFPVPTPDGRMISALHAICAQAVGGGIREIGIIVSPGQQEVCERYFAAAQENGFKDLPQRIEYIEQREPAGFGDAVLRGAEFIGGE